jgi:hypothetical protein
MPHPSREFKQSLRPPDFDSRLSMYALAATAAGVGMLALAQPAEGRIVYTKTHKQIGSNSVFHLELNHDGKTDFDLKDTFAFSNFTSSGRLFAVPGAQKNQVWGHTFLNRYGFASALYAGVQIGAKGQFLPGSGLMAQTTFNGGARRPPGQASCTAPWANVSNRYLGLKFVISGQVHFGWARLNVSCSNQHVTAVLTGYAYETVSDRPIVTGKEKAAEDLDSASQRGISPGTLALQPASLGQLALGALGRRE